jgi:catechol 2,3-dioxygenase-like lactoylglutathione lyase family enzyme
MLSDLDPICFVHTADVERARGFYVDTLGLEALEESPFALVLRSGHTTIRVTPLDTHVASGATVLGWAVADLESTLRELASRGVEPLRYDGLDQSEFGTWRSPSGAQVVWISDPDHNVVSFTQF